MYAARSTFSGRFAMPRHGSSSQRGALGEHREHAAGHGEAAEDVDAREQHGDRREDLHGGTVAA